MIDFKSRRVPGYRGGSQQPQQPGAFFVRDGRYGRKDFFNTIDLQKA